MRRDMPDTHGYLFDTERSMWRWRDWVIGSFNRNQPFDEFTIEQLAGDLLPDPTLDQLIATGFNRNHIINNEAGRDSARVFRREHRGSGQYDGHGLDGAHHGLRPMPRA